MIAKAKFQGVLAVSGLLCGNFAMADSVVVQGPLVYYSSPGLLNISLVPGGSLPSSCPVGTTLPTTISVPGATADSDVVVSGANAFVRTGNTVATVNITPACLADAFPSVGECIAHIDSLTGDMIVPCIEHQGTIYNAVFQQRGNSSNWELNSALPNVRLRNYPSGNR